jgi:hypothetical protein
MVEAAIHEIVDVVPVRHRLVPATRPMHMRAARLFARAAIGIRIRHRKLMRVALPALRMMQTPVVQIVHMPVMRDGRVAAVRAVRVGFAIMMLTRHCRSLRA